MEIVDQKIGSEGEVKVELIDKKLKVTVTYVGTDATGEVSLAINAKAFLDKLKAVIPGSLDDYIIDAAEAALP